METCDDLIDHNRVQPTLQGWQSRPAPEWVRSMNQWDFHYPITVDSPDITNGQWQLSTNSMLTAAMLSCSFIFVFPVWMLTLATWYSTQSWSDFWLFGCDYTEHDNNVSTVVCGKSQQLTKVTRAHPLGSMTSQALETRKFPALRLRQESESRVRSNSGVCLCEGWLTAVGDLPAFWIIPDVMLEAACEGAVGRILFLQLESCCTQWKTRCMV